MPTRPSRPSRSTSLGIESDPVVLDDHDDPLVALLDENTHPLGACVSDRVRDRLLGDPEQRDLDLSREPITVHPHRFELDDLRLVPVDLGQVIPEGGHQTEVVEAGGPQVGGQAVDVLLHGVGHFEELADPGRHLFGPVGVSFEQPQADLEGRQDLSRFVVELARDRTPFGLLQIDLLARQGLQEVAASSRLIEEDGVVDGDRRRRRETLCQLAGAPR